MVDESRFRYRRDSGASNGGEAAAPEARAAARPVQPARDPSREAPAAPRTPRAEAAARPDQAPELDAAQRELIARQEHAARRAAARQAAARQAAERQAAERQLAEGQPLEGQPAAPARPARERPAAERPVAERPVTERPAAERSAVERQPAQRQPAPRVEAPRPEAGRQDLARQDLARQDVARQAPVSQPPARPEYASRQDYAARQAAQARPAPAARPAGEARVLPEAQPAPATRALPPSRPAAAERAPAPERRLAAERPAAASARAPSGGQPADPLAELARLIGEQDPFADFADLKGEPEPAPRAADPRRAASPDADPRLAQRRALANDLRATEGGTAPRAAAPRAAARPSEPPPERADLSARGVEPQRRLAAPPQRAALVPPRRDAEPVDRSATSVRLGYGSLAHQAQVPPAPPEPEPRQPRGELGGAARAPQEFTRAPMPSAPRGYDDQDGDPYRAPPAADSRRMPQEPAAAYAYSAPQQREPDDEYDEYDEAYDPQYGEDGYMPPHGEEVLEGEARRRKGRMALLMAASVLGLIVAGTAGVFAYRMAIHGPALSSSNGPPVIRADASPSKIAAPPSANPPDAQQKLIYDRVGGTASGNERMLPREEQPVDVTTAAIRATPPATDPLINSLSTEPKRVRTLSVRADGSIVPEGASPGVAALAAYTASQAPGANPSLVTVPALPETATASTAPAAPAVSKTGDYVVQVASQRSEGDAMGSWKALKARYPNLLGSYTASVKKADLGDRGIFYRAQVGPFASRDQANELCQALRAQGGDCVVNKN